MIIITSFLLIIVKSQTTIQEIGCKIWNGNVCQTQCDTGYLDCINTICSYGYFLLDSSCVLCPYQGLSDALKLYCMDCVENPFNWNKMRTCSYDYSIESNLVQSGTYIKVTRPSSEIYWVGVGVTANPFKPSEIQQYQTYLCYGCLSFCTTLTDECSAITHQYQQVDKKIIGIQCQQGYYYYQNQCMICSLNCKECSINGCSICQDGYIIDKQGCSSCMLNCQNCLTQQNKQLCYNCYSPYIPSLDQTQCVGCGSLCLSCEYMTYQPQAFIYPTRSQVPIQNPQLQSLYIKRCRRCEGTAFITYDGINCETCSIKYCQRCYYQLDNSRTTQDLDFEPVSSPASAQLCQLCETRYQLSNDQKSCNSNPALPDQNCALSKITPQGNTCIQCLSPYIYDISAGKCGGSCSDSILNCLACYQYQSLDVVQVVINNVVQPGGKPTLYQCTQCDSGFYPDFFGGLCLECPSNCQTCWQYSLSQNFTLYLYKQTPLSATQKIFYRDQDILILCTQCITGYQLYGNQCLGCTSNCQTNNINLVIGNPFTNVTTACKYGTSYAYCSQCTVNFRDRSLKSDLSQCQTCPKNCLACRDRQESEINNPYFSPTVDDLDQYGRLCYLTQPLTGSNSKIVNYNSKLGIPVVCDYSSTPKSTGVCINSYSQKIYLYCNTNTYQQAMAAALNTPQSQIIYDLNAYYQVDAVTETQIKFDSLETQTLYISLNDQAIQNMDLQIIVIPDSKKVDNQTQYFCNIEKKTYFMTEFQKNIYSLVNFTIIIKPQKFTRFYLYGDFIFSNYQNITLQDIEFVNPTSTTTQLQIYGQYSTQVILKNIFIYGHYTTGNIIFYLQNINPLQGNNVTFYNLTKDDQITIKSNLTQMNYDFTKLFFNISTISNQNLFDLVSSPLNTFFVNGFYFNQTTITQSNIINTQDNIKNGIISINDTQIIYSQFSSARLVYSSSILGLLMNNTIIISTTFNDSVFLECNIYNIDYLYINGSKISNKSSIICPSEIALDDYASINYTSIQNVVFKNTQCNCANCFINYKSSFNQMGYLNNIQINNLYINNTDYSQLSQEILYSVSSSLISIKSVGDVIITNVLIDNNFGLSVFYLNQVYSLDANNINYNWSQPQVCQVEYDPIRQVQNQTIIIHPINNRIPSNSNCAGRKKGFLSFNSYLFYVTNFLYGIRLTNISIKQLLALDNSFIHIESYDVLENVTTQVTRPYNQFYSKYINYEYILLDSINIFNNSLVITESTTQLSCIVIISKQSQQIFVNNINFIGTHLHQIVQGVNLPSSACLFITSPKGNLQITNSYFFQNRATVITNGLVWIFSNSTSISKTQFIQTNILEDFWLDRLEEFQGIGENDQITFQNLDEIFYIQSLGSNLYLQGSFIDISQVEIKNGVAASGSVYISGENNLLLQISQTSFYFQINDLTSVTNGGCIYIDTSTSTLKLEFDQVYMEKCVTRYNGGCIFIQSNTKLQDIHISSSQFLKCSSLGTSFLHTSFSLKSDIEPQVAILDSIINDNDIINLMLQVGVMQTTEADNLLLKSTLIYQYYGSLSLKNCSITNIYLTSILYLDNVVKVNIFSSRIKDNYIFLSPLIFISTNLQDKNLIIISDFILQNNQQIDLLTETQYSDLYPNGCNLFKKETDFVQSTSQTCHVMEFYSQIYLDIYNFYQALISYDHDPLIDKDFFQSQNNLFQIPNSDKNSYVPIQILQDLLTAYYNVYSYDFNNSNYDLFECALNYMRYELYGQNDLSFIYIYQLNDLSQLSMTNIDIVDNNCTQCNGSALKIMNVIDSQNNLINFDDIQCSSNTFGYYGCIYITQYYEMNYYKQNFIQSNRLLEDTQNQLIGLGNTIQINNSNFYNNTAFVGACITITGLTTLITYSNFKSNVAETIGGAIIFNSLYGQKLRIFSVIFQGNEAAVGSALYINGTSLPDKTHLNIQFNSNVGSTSDSEQYPCKLSIQMQYGESLPISILSYNGTIYDGGITTNGYITSSSLIIDYVVLKPYTLPNFSTTTKYLLLPSGQPINQYKYYYSYTEEQVPYDWTFRIVNLDSKQKWLTSGLSNDSCSIYGRIQNQANYSINNKLYSNFTNINNIQFDTATGTYNLDNMEVYFDPSFDSNYFLELQIICSSIKIPVYSQVSPFEIQSKYNTNYQLLLQIRTIPCQLGEAYQNEKCVACADNTYSVTEGSSQCSGINTQTMEEVTPIKIDIKSGYWRPFANNNVIEYCTNGITNCNGGWTPGDLSCASGHIGALCESCDIYGTRGESYSISSKYSCGSCSSTVETNSLAVVGIALFTLVSMAFSVKGILDMITQFLREKVLQSMKIRTSNAENNLSILIKILMNYLLIIRALMTFKISFPKDLVSSITVLGNPNDSMAYSLDCFLIKMVDSIDILYFRVIWQLIMPLIYIVVFLLLYVFIVVIGLTQMKIQVFYTTFIYTFVYLQPTLTGSFISLLSSRRISGVQWIQSDVSYQYNTDKHQYWILFFIGPTLFIIAFGLPFLFLRLVKSCNRTLEEFNTLKKWGYFYAEYNKEAYLWEFVKIFEKCLVIIALSYYEDQIVIKGLMIFLVVFFYGAFTTTFTPYKKKKLNALDQLSTSVCAASLCLGVLIYSSLNEQLDYLYYLMFFIIIAINLVFLLNMVYLLFEGYLDKFQDQLDMIRDKIKGKYPNLEFKHPTFRKYLINRKLMKERVNALWAFLRYETSKGIKRRRKDRSCPIFQFDSNHSMDDISYNNFKLPPDSRAIDSRAIRHNNALIVINNDGEDNEKDFQARPFPRQTKHLFTNQVAQTPDIQKIYPISVGDEESQLLQLEKKVKKDRI